MTIPQSHRPGPWYGHGHPRSEKWLKKLGLWDRGMATDVKKPGLWDRGMVTGGPGEKPECWRPSPVKTSCYWWRMDVGVKIVTFRIAANTMAQNGRGRIQLFKSDTNVKKKKLILPPLTSQSKISFKKPGLTDRGMATDVLVENDFLKKMKKPGLWNCGVTTSRPGQKPDRKKMTRSVRQQYGLWRVKFQNHLKTWALKV